MSRGFERVREGQGGAFESEWARAAGGDDALRTDAARRERDERERIPTTFALSALWGSAAARGRVRGARSALPRARGTIEGSVALDVHAASPRPDVGDPGGTHRLRGGGRRARRPMPGEPRRRRSSCARRGARGRRRGRRRPTRRPYSSRLGCARDAEGRRRARLAAQVARGGGPLGASSARMSTSKTCRANRAFSRLDLHASAVRLRRET